MTTETYQLTSGTIPLLISMPHIGTRLPEALVDRLQPGALTLPDTDWHLEQLYDFARDEGATVLQATMSRYVIDLNRPPDGASLYPGQTTTGLVPLESFHGQALYKAGAEPNEAEIAQRLLQYWHPYHAELQAQIKRIKAEHGFVLLWDAHSINGELPRLFDGVLPELNFGTNGGNSASPLVEQAIKQAALRQPCTWVLNGRFKGGYITRNHGEPANGVHAVQLEKSQRIYMDETAPYGYRSDLANKLKPTLKDFMQACLAAARRASVALANS